MSYPRESAEIRYAYRPCRACCPRTRGALAALVAVDCSKPAAAKRRTPRRDARPRPRSIVGAQGQRRRPAPEMGAGSGEAATAPGADDRAQAQRRRRQARDRASPPRRRRAPRPRRRSRSRPASGFHVNTEFPIKLTLEAPAGVTLAKTEFTAGGSKAQGRRGRHSRSSSSRSASRLTAAAGGSVRDQRHVQVRGLRQGPAAARRSSRSRSSVAAK